MAGRPKKKVPNPPKLRAKKVEKPKRHIQKKRPKKAVTLKKIPARKSKAKSAKLVISNRIRSVRSHLRSQKETESPPQLSPMLIDRLIKRCQSHVKQMVIESIRPLLAEYSAEIVKKELSPIKLAVQSITKSISKRIDNLQISIADKVKAFTLAQIQSKVISSEKSLGEASQSVVVQNSLNTSESKIEDRFKRIKKSEKQLNNKLNHSFEEQTADPEFHLPKEKKKRGRKPKSYYATQAQQEVQESGYEFGDNQPRPNVREMSPSTDQVLQDPQSDSESKHSIGHEQQSAENQLASQVNVETQSVDSSIQSEEEKQQQPSIKLEPFPEISQPQINPNKEVTFTASNDKSSSNLKVLNQDSNSMIRSSSPEAQPLKYRDSHPSVAYLTDKEDLSTNAFNHQRVFWKESSCSVNDLGGRTKNVAAGKRPERDPGYKVLIIESKYQHDSDYFSFN